MQQLKLISVFFASMAALGNWSTLAHEFWIAPKSHQMGQGDPLVAELMVGRNMHGTPLPYLSSNFESFTITDRSGTWAVEGFEGDIPALSADLRRNGLHIITYQSQPSEAIFESWDDFLYYLGYEGLGEFAARHLARGLPQAGFKEYYSRNAKSYVQVGQVDPQDRDRPTGAPFELVVGQNPYSPDLASLTLQLLRLGKPVADRQVALFRYDGEIRRHLYKTAADGTIDVSLRGGGSFLFSATDLQPLEDEDAVWESHWASLTFALPIVLPPPHPLDPLNKIEIRTAMRIIGQSGHATRDTRVVMTALAEPGKVSVLKWQPGEPVDRHAFVVLRNGRETYEATVNLDSNKLLDWVHRPNVQPSIQSAEWARAQDLVKADERWLSGMARRGYHDAANIFCEALSAGFFDKPEEAGRRLVKMACYELDGTVGNIYGRPIEGLWATVDLDFGEVIEVIDTGAVEISQVAHRLDTGDAFPQEMLAAATAASANIKIDQNVVAWGPWSFHLGFDQRFGPVLSLASYLDRGQQRPVLYQGHLSEIFVPYMDASEGWYHRSYMDAGEYGLGRLSSPLRAGIDCPKSAVFRDAVLSSPIGAPTTRVRTVCLFERPGSGPLWRHWEALDGSHHGRVAHELVVRTVPSVGNYDYVIDWIFSLTGEITVKVGATGIDAVKGVNAKIAQEYTLDQKDTAGMLVAPNLVAVYHDHYFSFRLDLDVDGPANSFRRARLTQQVLPQTSARRSLWRLRDIPTPTETAISMRNGPEIWWVENPDQLTALGHQPGYQITVGSNATSLLAADDWPQKRAAFASETLWITQRKPGERAAAGAYPNQSKGGEGLNAFTNKETISDTDIVLWPTLGFHHVTRPEDWPVLPTLWHELRLRPFAFFERNPSLKP